MRVRVGGAETFVSGADLTPDGLVRAAQAAVSTVRGLAAVARSARPLTPVPVVTGEWATSIDIDPFAVSPDEHCFVVGGLGGDHGQGRGAGIHDFYVIAWTVETRVFASSEGSLLTQRVTRCRPYAGVRTSSWRVGMFGFQLPMFVPCSAGFEYFLRPGLHDQMHEAELEIDELVRIPLGTTEVGRKEVVLDGYAHSSLVGTVLLPALSLSRALGDEQDSSGTSILAPPEANVGKTFGSPLLQFGVVNAMPHYGAAKWDDDGVATTAAPLITDGRIVDYCGTRFTRPSLGRPDALGTARADASTPGTATAFDVQRPPSGIPASTGMQATTAGPSLAALAREIRDGFLVREVVGMMTDQQCASATIMPNLLFEVRRGQILRRITNAHIAVTTKKLWAGLLAVGNASTLRTAITDDFVGPPWQSVSHAVTAPAAHFHAADIVSSTGGRT
jgi:predicted Zn-dependent protease